ncbi:HD domain-containing protein [Ralstonia thomasii]|uniref:HD domain-containing protein n=1 Tax=Ralstonia thomasii TaxID=3058596 RepID=UPI00292DD364|nr:HD domain-containing protein [Ralstonia sp. LMG 18095]
MSTLNLTYMAMSQARRSHRSQQRKYTGDPYTIHLAEVAALVQTVAHRQRAVHANVMIATAWLHDVIEDCGVPVSYLRDVFGRDVALGVLTLSPTWRRGTERSAKRHPADGCIARPIGYRQSNAQT